jgi:predicted Fe-Mo cluster-binding NifX family protein
MRRVTRIAISADDSNGLDSVVSPHFGRCPYYVLVDLDGREVSGVSAVENPCFGQHGPGEVPSFIRSQRADVMLAGGMGRRAIGFFQQYGIQAATGATGTVRHALEQYLGGALREAEPCRVSTEHSHEEVVPEGTRVEQQASSAYEQDEAGRLREEVQMLQQQLDEAAARIERLTAGPQGEVED